MCHGVAYRYMTTGQPQQCRGRQPDQPLAGHQHPISRQWRGPAHAVHGDGEHGQRRGTTRVNPWGHFYRRRGWRHHMTYMAAP